MIFQRVFPQKLTKKPTKTLNEIQQKIRTQNVEQIITITRASLKEKMKLTKNVELESTKMSNFNFFSTHCFYAYLKFSTGLNGFLNACCQNSQRLKISRSIFRPI